MSNADESKYKYFDKKFLVFPDDECIGKRVFYANNYTALVSDIESGDFDRTGLIEEVKPYEQKPFKIRDEVDDILWKPLAYYDPSYEVKVAYSQGKQIQYKLPDGSWVNTVPTWIEGDEYRVKPDKWYVHEFTHSSSIKMAGSKFYKDNSNSVYVEFEGTKEECDKWIEEHTPRTRRMTNRELAKWCADNKGQFRYAEDSIVYTSYYYVGGDTAEVPKEVRIREWGSDEWHEPLVEVKE